MEWTGEFNVQIVMGMIHVRQKINNDQNGGFPIAQCVIGKPLKFMEDYNGRCL